MNTPKSLFSHWIEVQTGYSAKDLGFSQITSDLGQRVYYRVHTPKEPLVLCVYPSPLEPQNSFFEVHEFLHRHQFHVPQIFGKDFDRGLVLLEDLGESPLSGHITSSHFKRLVDLAIHLFHLRTAKTPPACVVSNALNFMCFTRELQFTETYLLPLLKFKNEECTVFQNTTRALIKDCDSWINTFCHRDLHINNIFLKNEKTVLIDFQDMRRGFGGYDLFSVLFERESLSISQKPDDLTWRLTFVQHYWDQTQNVELAYEDFLRRFFAIGIQRALKACGNFARSSQLYGKYIGPSLLMAEQLMKELCVIEPAYKTQLNGLIQLNLSDRWNNYLP